MPMIGAARVVTIDDGRQVRIHYNGLRGDVCEEYRLVLMRHHQNLRRNRCSHNVLPCGVA